jgi:hypothetical protein
MSSIEIKESLTILGRCGLKYTDEFGTEYFVDGEMIVDSKYDYVMFTDSIEYWKNYIQRSNPQNIEYTECFDKKSGVLEGEISYKNDFKSNLSNSKKREIADRIRILSLRDNFKLEIQ